MLVSSMSLEFLSLGTVDIGAVWGGHGPVRCRMFSSVP